MNAWDFVRRLQPANRNCDDPWTADDWRDFYHAIDSAMEKIARRHGWKPKGEIIADEQHEQRRLCAENEIPL